MHPWESPVLPSRKHLGLALLLASGIVAAQPPADPISRELHHLGETARLLNQSLPSFTCQETVTSEILRGKKVKQHIAFTANLRGIRDSSGTLHETFAVTSINGHPSTGPYIFPFYVAGGLNQMRYFTPGLQACYAYTLSPDRIDFRTAPDVAKHPQCQDEGIRGFALLDASGNPTHLERTASAQADRNLSLVPFSVTDFAPVELNGQTFQLSRHLLAERRRGNMTARFDATYSDCRLFHVSVTIEPPASNTPAPAGSPP